MRPELKEYDLDWLFAATFSIAKKLPGASEKEIEGLLKYVPYFKGLLGPLLSAGPPAYTFIDIFADYYTELIQAKERGKKVAMTTFCFDPSIFYAMDIVPVTLEVGTVITSILWKRGAFDFMDFCTEVGFSETGCSSQRGTMGAYLAGAGVDIDVVAINMGGVCDTNANAYSFIAEYLKKPFYGLDYPATITPDEVTAYHHKDYRALIRFLEDHTGNRFDIDRLRDILKETKRQNDLINELEEMQRLVPNPMPGIYHLLIYGAKYAFSGQKKFTKMLKEMVGIVRDNATRGRSGLSGGKQEKLRAFLFYIDSFALNVGMWDWLDKNGISHLGNLLSRFFPEDAPYSTGIPNTTFAIDTTDLDSMIDTLADINARMPMTRTIRGPYDAPNMWLEDTLSLTKIYQADCCIYNGTPGCRNTWSNVKLIMRDLEKNGLPTHLVYADAFDARVENWQVTKTRLDEFVNIRGLI